MKVFKQLGVPEEKLSSEVHGSFDDFVGRHAELLLAIMKGTRRPTKSLIETALAERFMNSLKGTRTTFAMHGCERCQLCTEKGSFCIDWLEDCSGYGALGSEGCKWARWVGL